MKKLLFLLFTGICLPFSVAFGQQKLPQFYNRWGLKSVGLYGNLGAEKFFSPLTFAYFNQNSGNSSPQLFVPPPGDAISQSDRIDEAASLGIELAWPVGKKQNELRAGLAIVDYGNSFSTNSHYNITPDTIRIHHISIRDEYLIAQASLDYVFYSKPILRHFRFLWRTGSTFGFSIPSYNEFDFSEEFKDSDAAYVFFNPDGSAGYNPYYTRTTYLDFKSIDSSPACKPASELQ